MASEYDDPHFQPPADIAGPEARAYEERIVELLRAQFASYSDPRWRLESIELVGQRPHTQILFHFTGTHAGPHVERTRLWESEYPTNGAIEYGDSLHSAASVGGWIWADWLAGDLEGPED